MKRLVLAIVGVVSLLAITAAAALAEWPTSCVEINDLIEAGRGNDHNVGIYQRVHGDQAEAVCRSEHADSGFRFGARPYQLPSKSDPAAYTQAFVEQAIARYNAQGLQATLDYYNSPRALTGRGTSSSSTRTTCSSLTRPPRRSWVFTPATSRDLTASPPVCRSWPTRRPRVSGPLTRG